MTTTLRGCLNADLSVRVLKKGIHSGMGSGVVPSTFRIARQLIERVENSVTGKVLDELQVKIPDDKLAQTKLAASMMDESFWDPYPFYEGVKPIINKVEEALINTYWSCELELIGQEGIPQTSNCGNVFRDETILRLSFRLPPTLDEDKAYNILKSILEADPPYNSHISFIKTNKGNGWNSNETPASVMNILNKHNQIIFGAPTICIGSGGSIPFINLLQSVLPKTLLLVTGASLPDANAHAPNENLNLEYLTKFSQSI